MDSDGRESRKITATLAAAGALRRAARLSDPARRADAVWGALVRLPPGPAAAAPIVTRIEDDGGGEAEVADPRLLMAAARDLEDIASTARGLEGRTRPDSGRIRSRALRADSPTTIDPWPHRRRRRRARRGRRGSR